MFEITDDLPQHDELSVIAQSAGLPLPNTGCKR